ncbi:MAG: hypothetical protein HY736_12625 [Verrucomicrobia bacterium]|nr:hypothetical protein [Verrucomicrobiota bacterium]
MPRVSAAGFSTGLPFIGFGSRNAVTVVLVAIAMLACLIRAVRAARVPPMEALRSDCPSARCGVRDPHNRPVGSRAPG